MASTGPGREYGTEILLPVLENHGYRIIGYNWFNLSKGQWGSCATWETVDAAIAERRLTGHVLSNAEIEATAI
jgi:hypothetical protein